MKKRTTKITAFLISLMMLVSSSVMPFYAFANDNPVIEKRQNPFYAGKEIAYSTLDSVNPSKHSISKTLNSHTFYSDGVELYKVMRKNLINRKSNFTIYYLSTSQVYIENVLNKIEKIYVNATDDALSQTPTDGDYIRWVVSSYGIKPYSNSRFLNEVYRNGYYYYTFDLVFEYYDTASQEKVVDSVVNNFVASIDTDALTDYEVIKKIHDFICSKTTYDYDAAYDLRGREYATTAYGALVKGKCICQGYAVAFYRICKELGYKARFVSSDPNWGCHAWNIVQLDGKYYFVDPTWDDTYIDDGEKDKAYAYFLVDYKTSKEEDSYRSEHTLDDDYYDDEYFWENYREKLDSKKYNANNKNLFSQSVISLSNKKYTYSGNSFKPEVSIKSNGYPASYTVSYSSNKNPGMATVNINSADGSTVLSHRNFVIVPKKMTDLSLAASGRTQNSITVQWDKASESVSGYSVEVYRNGKWNAVKTVSSSEQSATIDSLSAAVSYRFRIRSFSAFSKRNFYGAYSNIYKTSTKPKKPTIAALSTKSKSITAKWRQIKCSGYEIQYSTDKSMKNAKTVFASSTAVSKKISNLKKRKTYYVRLRAYKNYTTASGKSCVCYSSWSAKKSIKCK